ncbi:MAG: 3-deoxy-D-manno-octulosonic acid transferase, partial [Marinosulfonomonas sp.]|nr:3-deoxy-D-manno-octulosonic acid transferase [Marinosulfonomonas sp.]
PDRAARILNHAHDLGFQATILQDGTSDLAGIEIAIIDRIGELGVWYRLADRCFIGGSLADVGGHNPYEPARLNCAITHGPNIQNFADDYAAFHAAGGARKVLDADDLAAALTDPDLLATRKAAAQVAEQGKQALTQTAQRLVALL